MAIRKRVGQLKMSFTDSVISRVSQFRNAAVADRQTGVLHESLIKGSDFPTMTRGLSVESR